MKFSVRLLAPVLICMFFHVQSNGQLPDGFELQVVSTETDAPMGTAFINDSMMYVWYCPGQVSLFINDIKQPEHVVNIWDEVGCWSDHGLLGFAISPDFDENGYIYLLYNVDQHHLLHYGTQSYDPFVSVWHDGSIGRLTRYQVDPSDPGTVIPGSRTILIGETPDDGIPILTSSHGVGSLVFGSDGTLMISTGDGSTWWALFNGGPPFPTSTYDSLGLALGVITHDQDIGSYRSQYVNTYSGKVLRIDPETGDGVPSNPFYSETEPDSPRSKVWSLGLRNPFRMTHKPYTGSTDPSAGDPGTLYIGDVGYFTWEEINVANGPGQNFGWPMYEGMEIYSDYNALITPNRSAPNPSYDPIACPFPEFRFQDLLVQENQQHTYSWVNPCDNLIEIPDSVDRFAHSRPVLSYQNSANTGTIQTVLPGFDDAGNAVSVPLTGHPTAVGEQFTGLASLGGDFYVGARFPEEYFGAYFQTDYSGWTRTFWFDEEDQLERVENFSNSLGLVVNTSFNPYDECLYFCSLSPVQVQRVCFTGNVSPRATATADVMFGTSPLTVELDGSESFDPDGDPITFNWDLGNSQTSDQESLTHTFTAPSSEPHLVTVQLTVSDTADNVGTDEVFISLNNTPPQVDITSIEDGELYQIMQSNFYDLEASVVDLEHGAEDLEYRWELYLHHNTHFHLTRTSEDETDNFEVEGIGCEEGASYYYRLRLEVTDAAGLTGVDEKILNADCITPPPADFPQFNEVVAYPNPTSGLFTLRGPFTAETDYRIELFTLDGKRVYESVQQLTSDMRLVVKLPELNSRMLLIRVVGNDVNWSSKLYVE